MNNQASEDEPINQHLVCLWRLLDIEETIADAEPEELVDLHSKLVALSTDITKAVLALIRTEKLKLLAEVRERVIGEDVNIVGGTGANLDNQDTLLYVQVKIAQNVTRNEQRAELDKLEAEL